MGWFLAILAAIALGALLLRRPPQAWQSATDRRAAQRVLAVHGAARCLEGLALLESFTHRPADLPAVWELIELPLLQALPDCPPEAKPRLVRALDAAALACANRDTARRIVTMRHALVG